MPDTQTTLRDTLASSFDAVESASAPSTEVITQEQVPERPRDETGKFTVKPKEEAVETVEKPQAQVQTQTETTQQRPNRPSTWKKDYWEAYDKLAAENPQLAQYINQRESEYKTGVSTYKAEADNARRLNEAIAPFIPDLQRNNIDPTVWISNLGNAHRKLALGSPDEKLQMFAQLARDYGVPLPGLQQQGQVDPRAQWMEQQLNELRGTVTSFVNQQAAQQQAQINNMVESFKADTEKYPHFESVRENMAQLLEAGLAPDLETAYHKAVRMDDGLFDSLLASRQQQSASQVQATVQKAKSQAISPKTSTPRSTTTATGPKDLRSTLEENLDKVLTGRV